MNIIVKEINTHLDAFDIYSIFKDVNDIILLDSSRDHESLGQFSFLGINPFKTLKGRENSCYLNGIESQCDIFDKLSELLKQYKIKNSTDLPFIGGCMGYFSYDLGLIHDNIESNSVEDIIVPHYYFVFYDNLIIFDNKSGRTYISACGKLEEHHKSIASIEDKIMQQSKVKYEVIPKRDTVFSSNFTHEEYVQAVSRVKEYIRSGDIYIANMTQRFTANTNKSCYDIYKDLRNINPAPFAALMKLEGLDIISASPERFIKINNKLVETRPIKGTRPRGSNPEEDERYRNELLNSEKDMAELLMIVDLERNDLSKVCKPHSVKVTELFKLEEYSTVFHLASTVVGELNDGINAVQCMKACFPGGSITGAPKIRAMEIIDELEGLKRSLYTGCLGYFSFDGNADFNIVIRTIIKKDNTVYFGVGGGITWDSDEESEYQETLDKAKALMKVI
ncbi:MAG: aminodeoxychorismate synthase component I [Lutisporaceae bacterium]